MNNYLGLFVGDLVVVVVFVPLYKLGRISLLYKKVNQDVYLRVREHRVGETVIPEGEVDVTRRFNLLYRQNLLLRT